MNFIALKMLTGDRAKYLGLIFAIAFCTFLLENQTSIFASILNRTGSQILDVTDADVWVMDAKTEYFEQTKALKDTDLTRVRGVTGVDWAVKLFKGAPVARTRAGKFATCILLGLDDATLTGAPRKMLLGSWQRLQEPDSIVIDNAGYILLYPGEPLELDRELEMNDHRVRIVGISDASAPFLSNPVIHTRYSEAVNFIGRERTQLSYVLVRLQPGLDAEEVCRRIEAQTGLRARTTDQFRWDCIEEHGHTGKFRDNHHDRPNRWDRGRWSDFLFVYAGKSEAVRRSESHRRHQPEADRHGAAAGICRWGDGLRAGHGPGRRFL
jgi:putative ABC transport system permease protein